ncbi:MAG: hypothetical protein HY314_01025 [Acidobacteria bacterium]|nr:hypothetical protein [Acidobacteriota bacterium]
MNRTLIALISILAVVTIVAIGEYDLNVSRAIAATRQPSNGCAACHPKLSEQVPEGHAKARLSDVKYCLTCHSLESAASAYAWTRHRNHYAQSPFAGTCWSCHQIDAAGTFKLIGVDGGNQIKATEAEVDKMQLQHVPLLR